MKVATEEKNILRELAKRVAAISQEPVNLDKHKLWIKHNRLEKTRPMILIFPEGSWCELIPEETLECSSDFGRMYERNLRQRIYRWERLKDDTYLSSDVWSFMEFENTQWGFNIELKRTESERGSYAYDWPLKTPEDFARMTSPRLEIDEQKTQRNFEDVQDIFGDIVKVKVARSVWDFQIDTNLVDTLFNLRGSEKLLMDLYERPEWVHEVLSFMTSGTLDLLDHVEKNIELEIINDTCWNGMGHYYISDELPAKDHDGKHTRLCDLWGNSAAQYFVSVSPEMHYEFGLQYQNRIMEKFGLNCYGCCEPLDRKMDYVRQIPNLRRVSISPWADVDRSAEQLQDEYIYSWKPAPFYLAEPQFDTEKVRSEITKAVAAARRHNCIFEMTLKDTHTVRDQPERFEEWMRIARQLVDE